MRAQGTTANPLQTDADTIVVGLFEGEDIAHELPGGELGALLDSGEASREFRRLALTHAEGRRFVLVGLGTRESFDAERARTAAALAHQRARELTAKVLCWELPHHLGEEIVAGLVEGTLLHSYQFDRYKPPEHPVRIERLLISAHHDVSTPVNRAALITTAQNRARNLGNTPANDLTPEALATYAGEIAERHASVTVSTMDEEAIRDAGMGAFAAVAQGSREPARLIRIEYDGTGPAATPRVGLIGKAVTFDSGGLALKQSASMHEMKFDMAGGAAVTEAIAALAELGSPVPVLGVIGATENMPSGSAVKPGDIVRALDGTTIEANNPDAEGRLVMADCLTLARGEGCERLIDIATLTIIDVVLGSTYAGLMSNDDVWAKQLIDAGQATGELLWRLPLHREFAEMVKGRYAQLTNRSERRVAMPVTAAEFLHHFAGEVPWSHIDIAGTAYDVGRPYLLGKGATGFGVRLLVHAIDGLARHACRGS